MTLPPFGEPPENDPIEVWGRRLGRGLAILVGLYVAYYLFSTYLR